jgi:hypothetical protein
LLFPPLNTKSNKLSWAWCPSQNSRIKLITLNGHAEVQILPVA